MFLSQQPAHTFIDLVHLAHNKWANNALVHKSRFNYYSGNIKMLFSQLEVKLAQSAW